MACLRMVIGTTHGEVRGAPMDSTQKQLRRRIGKTQTLMRQIKTIRLPRGPATRAELMHIACPFVPQGQNGSCAGIHRTASRHSYATERGDFAGPAQRRQFLAGFNRARALFQLIAVKRGVRPVLRPHAAHIAGGTGTQAVIRTAAPVVDVVFAGKSGDPGYRFEFQRFRVRLCGIGRLNR
jgi:hypothetical protein